MRTQRVRTSHLTGAGNGECFVEPILTDGKMAARMLGFSLSHFYGLVNAGRIGPTARAFGKSKRYVVAELRQWARAGCPKRQEWIEMKHNGERQ